MGLNVDKDLLPMKAHYFLFNAGTAPVVPFMPTFAKQMGFSSVVVGTIYTILPIIGMVAKPIFGLIADRFQRHKSLFLLFQLITAVAFFCILGIPSIPQKSSAVFMCNDNSADFKYCASGSLDECIVNQITGTTETVDTLGCTMSCPVQPWMWDSICNQTDKCSGLDKSVMELTTTVPMDKIEKIGNCVHFLMHDTFISENIPLQCPHRQDDLAIKSYCSIECNNTAVMELVTESNIHDSAVTRLYQFWLFFLCLALSWVGMAVVVSVGDAICFEMLGERHHLYGKQRLWGAVGWGTLSIISGYLVDAFSDGNFKNYTPVFVVMLFLIGADMICSTKLKHTQTKMSSNILKDVGQLFLSLRIMVFFLWCIAVGLCTALIWNFLFWHLEDLAGAQEGCDHLNWIKTLQGLAMGIQCFGGELPFFFLSGWILRKIGHINAMSLVLLGMGVRFLLYSVLENPWWVLPIELMNGITFGIFYSTMASYASIVAPPGTEATLQGLVGSIFEGIGVSVGSLIGGILFEEIGGSETFRWFGIGALVVCVLHIVAQKILERMPSGYGDVGAMAQYSTPIDAIHMLEEQETPSRT